MNNSNTSNTWKHKNSARNKHTDKKLVACFNLPMNAELGCEKLPTGHLASPKQQINYYWVNYHAPHLLGLLFLDLPIEGRECTNHDDSPTSHVWVLRVDIDQQDREEPGRAALEKDRIASPT